MTSRLYEYVVWIEEKLDKDGEVVELAEVVVQPQIMIAEDDKIVAMKAARMLTDEHESKLDRVQISIRPF